MLDLEKVKRKRRIRTLDLLYNHEELLNQAYSLKISDMKLKSILRKEIHLPICTGWMVQVYNGQGYVHHTSHYQSPWAWKAMKTAAKNSKYGYARLVNKSTGMVMHTAYRC